MTDALHTKVIAQELARIFDTDLKTSLNLQSVMIGDIQHLPAPTITNLVNGIWIKIPRMNNEPSELPKQLFQEYKFRIVYVRRIANNENPTIKSMEDGEAIFNKLLDKLQLPDITNMPTTGHVLWVMPDGVEYEPPEDDYVARLAADFIAIAIPVTVAVRTRRT